MSSWAGFSDEDLRKMRQQEPVKKAATAAALREGAGARKPSEEAAAAAKARPQRAVRPMKAPDAAASTPVPPSDHPTSEIHGAPSAHSLAQSAPSKFPEIVARTVQPNATASENASNGSPGTPESMPVTENRSNPGAVAVILSESDGLSREMGNLESFRAKQQMMEELNKKKKHMLESAIAERQKRTTAESKKLQRIQKELVHIDQQLTVDVSILRNRIEESAREFAEAQRRYDSAEKEFVAAKIEVHKKAHMKEQLTEHLYTIIHQNELRKAKKLAELMEKLELEDAERTLDEAEDSHGAAAAATVPPILLLDTATSGVGLLKPAPLSLHGPAPAADAPRSSVASQSSSTTAALDPVQAALPQLPQQQQQAGSTDDDTAGRAAGGSSSKSSVATVV